MEIERKWLVEGWPAQLTPQRTIRMAQGYVATRPTVRIRSEEQDGHTQYVLCFKGKPSPDGLARQEIETLIEPELFSQLEQLIGQPLIQKEQRQYALEGGLILEVNEVDAGQPGAFFYAEVEFDTQEQARSWQPQGLLAQYLTQEVTGTPGQNMAAYWNATRMQGE